MSHHQHTPFESLINPVIRPRLGQTGVRDPALFCHGRKVGFIDNAGDHVMIYVDGGAGGNIDVTIRYSNGTIDTQYKSLYVNTVDVARVDFAPTGGWTKFANKVVTIKLNSGSNTIKISRDGDDTGGTDLDYLYVPIGKASTKP